LRQRNKPWADEFLNENDHIILKDPSQYKGKWKRDVFQNDRPIHVEVGVGKGQFITEKAKRHPDVNFLGIELAKSIIVTAGEKVLSQAIENVYLMQENAQDILGFFSEGEIAALYLNFSDPWPKNRHEKRRLTFHTFLDKYRHILQAKGKIMMKTDNASFFEYSLVSFSKAGMILEEVDLDLHQTPKPNEVMTEYEERFIRKGNPIYRCTVRL